MKAKKSKFPQFALGVLLLGTSILPISCIGQFEDINTRPGTPTKEDLVPDNVSIGAFFPQLQLNVIPAVTSPSPYQLQQGLIGDIYSGYMSAINNWNGGSNNNTYFFQTEWLDHPYKTVFSNAWSALIDIKRNITGDLATSPVYAWAEILKVASMSRFTDLWGPMPYLQVGSGQMQVPYDSQEVIYKEFFKQLNSSIDVLTGFVLRNPGVTPMKEFDLVYAGDYSKWVKFANSLKLRLAMRIVYVLPDLAQQMAQEAVNHPIGVIQTNADNALLKSSTSVLVKNPIFGLWSTYGETRMGASMESIMKGYNDPRLPCYFQSVTIGTNTGYFGVRIGIPITSIKTYEPFSSPNIQITDPVIWFTAAEVAFLKAEGELRGWEMGTTTEEAYKRGVTLSFEQYGLPGVTDYLNNEDVPVKYTDLVKPTQSINAVSTITVKWDEIASFEKKLERIMTQKWIAVYPNGNEAWAEFRRTGYPKLFQVLDNRSVGNSVSTTEQIRRYPFPAMEYNLNKDNMPAALSLLGGPDTGGTKLWWDKKK